MLQNSHKRRHVSTVKLSSSGLVCFCIFNVDLMMTAWRSKHVVFYDYSVIYCSITLYIVALTSFIDILHGSKIYAWIFGCDYCVLLTINMLWHLLCILLGVSPASDCCMPTFRNPLSVPSSRAGCRVWEVSGGRSIYIPGLRFAGAGRTNEERGVR